MLWQYLWCWLCWFYPPTFLDEICLRERHSLLRKCSVSSQRSSPRLPTILALKQTSLNLLGWVSWTMKVKCTTIMFFHLSLSLSLIRWLCFWTNSLQSFQHQWAAYFDLGRGCYRSHSHVPLSLWRARDRPSGKSCVHGQLLNEGRVGRDRLFQLRIHWEDLAALWWNTGGWRLKKICNCLYYSNQRFLLLFFFKGKLLATGWA